MNNMNKLWLLPLLCAPLLFSGCSSCYTVSDPTTKKVYYTKKLDHKRSGAVEFKDGMTGQKITIQNSEVKKISHSDYNKAIGK